MTRCSSAHHAGPYSSDPLARSGTVVTTRRIERVDTALDISCGAATDIGDTLDTYVAKCNGSTAPCLAQDSDIGLSIASDDYNCACSYDEVHADTSTDL